MADSLSPAESDRWTSWKRACDLVMHEVEGAIGRATGLSGADFAVLSRLVELGGGTLRQQELAGLLGWERSRLSRQLTRMAERHLVIRRVDGTARMIVASPAGSAALAAARPAHAAAVRRALLRVVPPAQDEQFWDTVEEIATAST